MAKINYPTNIICVPRQLTSAELTANINPREHGFVSKTQTLIPVNINEFTVYMYMQVRVDALLIHVDVYKPCTAGNSKLRVKSPKINSVTISTTGVFPISIFNYSQHGNYNGCAELLLVNNKISPPILIQYSCCATIRCAQQQCIY